MKRIIALFAVFALVFCLTFVPVKAEGTAWSLPFSKIETLLDLAQQLFSGAEVNLAEISNQMLGLYEFVLDYEDYINENGVYVPTLSYDQAQALQLGLSSLALNGEDVLTATSDLTIPIKSSDIAHFINYSTDWIKRYKSSEDVVVPSPDPDYLTYLDYINGTGFFFSGWTYNTLYPQYTNISLSLVPVSSYSWLVFPESGITSSSIQSNNNSNYWLSNTCEPTSVYITSTASGYRYSYTGVCPSNFTYFGNTYNSAQYRVVGGSSYIQAGFTNVGTYSYTSGYFNNLELAFQDLAHRAKNVDIYVDGILWSQSGNNAINDPFVQLGAVALGDLNTTTFPVYTLDQEGDLGLDVGAFADWLDGVIKSGATAISLGDVIADGIEIVDTETGERAVTDDDAEDVAKVIAGVQVTTAPAPSGSPTPSPTPKPVNPIIPPLKIIPPLLDPVLRPSDIPRQTTVLSEIIDATNKTVPQDIMILFWSTIGLLVVGGLIYIMHK